MITSIVSYCLTIGGVIGTFLVQNWWVVLIPPVIMIALVAPYKLWKKTSDKYEKITKKRLEISLADPVKRQYKDDIRCECFHEWYRVRVDNPTALPISNCYGKLVKFTSKSPWPDSPYVHLPQPGIMFPWSSYSGRGKLTKIGNNDFDFLDILVFDGSKLKIVVLDDASGKRDLTQYILLTDEYDLEIQIGSQDEAFSPSCVTLKVEPYIQNGKEHLKMTMQNYDSDCFTRLE